jgi:hypothetical protein
VLDKEWQTDGVIRLLLCQALRRPERIIVVMERTHYRYLALCANKRVETGGGRIFLMAMSMCICDSVSY